MNATTAQPSRKRESFPGRQRVRKRREFLQIYEHGRKEFCRYAVIFANPNELGYPRIGVTATRKLGKANVRNKIKRWVREVYRRQSEAIGLSALAIDMVVNIKASAASATFAEFSDDLTGGLRRAASRSNSR